MTDADNTVDFLSDLLARARSTGADAADAMLVESAGLAATRRLGKLEKVERAEGTDLGLRVFVGRRQALVSTGDLARREPGAPGRQRAGDRPGGARGSAMPGSPSPIRSRASSAARSRRRPGAGRRRARRAGGGGRGCGARPAQDHQLRRCRGRAGRARARRSSPPTASPAHSARSSHSLSAAVIAGVERRDGARLRVRDRGARQ